MDNKFENDVDGMKHGMRIRASEVFVLCNQMLHVFMVINWNHPIISHLSDKYNKMPNFDVSKLDEMQ